MTTNQTPINSTITPETLNTYLDKYSPRADYLGQWNRLRPDVFFLIRQMAPQTIEQATRYLVSLGKLFAGELALDNNAALAQLLTDTGINRTIARLNLAGSPQKSTQGHRATLTHLHRCLAELPPVLSGPRQVRLASEPITAGEVDQLLENLVKSHKPMDLHVRRRLIVALGAGLTGAKADAASISMANGVIIAIADKSGKVRPLSKKWISRLNAAVSPELESYLHPSEQALSGWLRRKSLAHLWPRLRDEWLLEQMDGTEPAFVQMRKAEITEYDLNRLLLRWGKVALTERNSCLRERKVFLQSQCALAPTPHDSLQDLNKGVLDKESGITMKASNRGKISKAKAQRMNAAHLATVMDSPQQIPEIHRVILTKYICKAAPEKDQAVVHAAFITVMERTSHILSKSFFIKNCSDVANLTAWAHRMGRDISWQHLMDHKVISAYIQSAISAGNSAHYSQRLRRLKSLAGHLNPGIDAPPQVKPVGHKAVSDPYTNIEMAAITRIALIQPSANITRQLAFILGACRGAGAGATELRDLRGKDVDDRGADGIYITLGAGERKRTIPIRRQWESYMRRGVAGLAPSSLAIGTVRNRKNIAGEVLGRTVALGKDAPHIEAGRLRTTYIAELMSQAIPVQVILSAAGLVGARTLTDLARRFSQEEINACFGVLRGESK